MCLGGTGADRMFGGSGKDSFIGGAGKDAIAGGAGADIIAFTLANWGGDRVGDFEDGLDILRFKRTIADAVADFDIAGNGTKEVTLAIGSQTLELNGVAAITLTAADFQFVA